MKGMNNATMNDTVQYFLGKRLLSSGLGPSRLQAVQCDGCRLEYCES